MINEMEKSLITSELIDEETKSEFFIEQIEITHLPMGRKSDDAKISDDAVNNANLSHIEGGGVSFTGTICTRIKRSLEHC